MGEAEHRGVVDTRDDSRSASRRAECVVLLLELAEDEDDGYVHLLIDGCVVDGVVHRVLPRAQAG